MKEYHGNNCFVVINRLFIYPPLKSATSQDKTSEVKLVKTEVTKKLGDTAESDASTLATLGVALFAGITAIA